MASRPRSTRARSCRNDALSACVFFAYRAHVDRSAPGVRPSITGAEMTDVLSRNNVKVSGSGTQPMIFAHGFGCDQTMWRFVAPAFEADYRVILFDYVGSGKADATAYDPERYSS